MAERNRKDALDTSEILDVLKLGRKVSVGEKCSLGLVQFGGATINVVFDMYLGFYYISKLGLPESYFILANLIFLFWNTINDFLFGIYADRTNHPLGRRIPYLRYGAVFVGFLFVLFWFPFPGTETGGGRQLLLFFQLLTCYCLYDTIITITGISFGALMLELTESTEERTSISLYSNIFTALGGMSIIFVPMLFDLGLEVFRVFIVMMGILASALHLIASYVLKERKELYQTIEQEQKTFKETLMEVKRVFSKKIFYVPLMLGFASGFLSRTMNTFSKYMGWVFYNNSFELVITGILYAVSYLGFFIFQQLAKKREVEKLIVRVAQITITLVLLLFLIDLIFNIPAIYMVIIIFTGILYATSLFNFLFTNTVIDKDELETGERREALYSASSALIMVPIGNIVAIVGFGILGAFGLTEGVATWQGQQNLDSVLIGIKILFVFVPLLCGGLIILSQRINPLKGEALVEFKKKLLAFHEKKEEDFKRMYIENSREKEEN